MFNNLTCSGEAGWPAAGLFEYLLVGHPDARVSGKVIAEKNYFTGHYQEKIAARTAPHIAVANFLASEPMESTIIKWMQRICGARHSFTVTLNNYSGIPAHTIYLRVQDPQPFQELAIQLQTVDEFIQASACPPARLIRSPYLSIAGRLPEQVYNKAMADYAQKTFHASFMLDELLLLRRQHQFDACKTIQVFRLKPPADNFYSDVA
ncbi:MAG: 2'-5' RNA ligase family protein [Chitinophagaceae bacterium]